MIKIETVRIDRFKILKDLDIDLKGKSVLLIGDNGVGKSSLMQFIRIALGESGHIPPDTNGEGLVVANKNGDKYAFKVEIKGGKSKVVIEGPDGLKDSRKGTLAQIVGAMEFDINKFVELSKTDRGRKEQIEMYKSFLPEDIKQELARMENNIKVAFDDRTENNRQIKFLEGAIKEHVLANYAFGDRLDFFVQVDVAEMQAAQKEIINHNSMVDRALEKQISTSRDIDRIKSDMSKKAAEIARLTEELNLLKANMDQALQAKEKVDKWILENPRKDPSEIDKNISKASESNANYAHAQDLKKKISLKKKYEEDVENATILIEAGRESIRTFVKEASPIDGLYFEEDKLIFNGCVVHPDSMATSEIIELGIRMKMYENPDLGVLFIEHGESLGRKRYEDLLSISEKYGWQLFIEEVKRDQGTLKVELIGPNSMDR